jgi:hypothetical protein
MQGYYILASVAAAVLVLLHVVNVTRFLASIDKRLALVERDVSDIRLWQSREDARHEGERRPL